MWNCFFVVVVFFRDTEQNWFSDKTDTMIQVRKLQQNFKILRKLQLNFQAPSRAPLRCGIGINTLKSITARPGLRFILKLTMALVSS